MTVYFHKSPSLAQAPWAGALPKSQHKRAAKCWLFDTQPDAVPKPLTPCSSSGTNLQEKGRLEPAEAGGLQKPPPRRSSTARPAKDCHLVVEAIVERLDIKKNLFTELEKVLHPMPCWSPTPHHCRSQRLPPHCNAPQQFAGYHFFNPVPLMKVVEVIAASKPSRRVRATDRICPPVGPHACASARHTRLHRQPRRAAVMAPRRCAS
jgi:3-hydroxybutyryl-CoA dehydrogenase